MAVSEQEIRSFGFESIFECIFVQPYVFKDVGLCKPRAASKTAFISGSMVFVRFCEHILGQARNFIQGVLLNTKYFCCYYQR